MCRYHDGMLARSLAVSILALTASASRAVAAPKAAPADVPALLESTAFVRGLDEQALMALVPTQSGLLFTGCPNCTSGHQELQLVWLPERPSEVRCQYCGHRYPSAKYPMDKAVAVRGPNGAPQRYPYWENPDGYRYFFGARRDYAAREYLEARVRDLARLYAATGQGEHARRAALLVDRFAQVFPHWCYHYDMPFQQKVIYDGDVAPEQFRPGYRTARWSRWAYRDVPVALVEAYETIRPSGVFEELSRERGVDVAARIENDLFRTSARQVLANTEPFHNMSPAMWYSLVRVGPVLQEPEYRREVLRRLRVFLETRFFYDGSWMEGAPSYHDQIQGGLDLVLEALGASDASEVPFGALARTHAALMKMRLPDGRLVPVHDTWHNQKLDPLDETSPFLLPAMGHACLGGGQGARQTQFHLTWSGGYGHQHSDNLSLIAFAGGREMLSDIGYTHTKYRSWTLATASHNTVVVDGENQESGSSSAASDGSLRLFDAADARVQVVSAGGERAYSGKAELYRRTLILVGAGSEGEYAVDLFEIEGGKTHDYFLHGDADQPARVTANIRSVPLATLLPHGFDWRPTRNEGETAALRRPHYAYGFLRNLRSGKVPAGSAIDLRFTNDDADHPALRAVLLSEPNSTLVLGENPSIRRAEEDDDKLDALTRPFAMLRHEASNGRSRFAAVLEPYSARSRLDRVETLKLAGAALALRLVSRDTIDWIVVGAPKGVALPVGRTGAAFRGEVGVLSTRAGIVEHAYALGEGGWQYGNFRQAGRPRMEADMLEAERDTLVLAVATAPPIGATLLLITADGWTYPFTVASVSTEDGRCVVRVSETPELSFDSSRELLRFKAFPARDHRGAVRVEWFK